MPNIAHTRLYSNLATAVEQVCKAITWPLQKCDEPELLMLVLNQVIPQMKDGRVALKRRRRYGSGESGERKCISG